MFDYPLIEWDKWEDLKIFVIVILLESSTIICSKNKLNLNKGTNAKEQENKWELRCCNFLCCNYKYNWNTFFKILLLSKFLISPSRFDFGSAAVLLTGSSFRSSAGFNWATDAFLIAARRSSGFAFSFGTIFVAEVVDEPELFEFGGTMAPGGGGGGGAGGPPTGGGGGGTGTDVTWVGTGGGGGSTFGASLGGLGADDLSLLADEGGDILVFDDFGGAVGLCAWGPRGGGGTGAVFADDWGSADAFLGRTFFVACCWDWFCFVCSRDTMLNLFAVGGGGCCCCWCLMVSFVLVSNRFAALLIVGDLSVLGVVLVGRFCCWFAPFSLPVVAVKNEDFVLTREADGSSNGAEMATLEPGLDNAEGIEVLLCWVVFWGCCSFGKNLSTEERLGDVLGGVRVLEPEMTGCGCGPGWGGNGAFLVVSAVRSFPPNGANGYWPSYDITGVVVASLINDRGNEGEPTGLPAGRGGLEGTSILLSGL